MTGTTVSPQLACLSSQTPARRSPEMSRTQSAPVAVEAESDVHTRRRAQEAVQEAMDRRDNGGDSAATDN
jgi:hypothetical protein